MTLASGTLLAQVIPIAVSPILTRLFSPEDFGAFSLFVVVTIILGGVAAARYELAIMLPSSQREAEIIAWLSGAVASLFSLFLLIPCFLWRYALADWIGDPELAKILPWLPLAVWLLSLGMIISALANRAQKFSLVAKANVIKSASMSGLQLGAGWSAMGAVGLVLGHLVGGVLMLLSMRKESGARAMLEAPALSECARLARVYRDFPKYSLWAALANGISVNVLSFLLPVFYSLGALGFYSIVQRVLAAPSAVLGNAIGQVFYQRASVELRERGTILNSFHSAWFRLLAISIPPFFLVYLCAEAIFGFVFGGDWVVAGRYAEILAPMFWVRFWVSPLSLTNQLLLQNKFGLLANLALLIISLSVVVISAACQIDVEGMLRLISVLLTCFYLVFFVFLYHSARCCSRYVVGAGDI